MSTYWATTCHNSTTLDGSVATGNVLKGKTVQMGMFRINQSESVCSKLQVFSNIIKTEKFIGWSGSFIVNN